MNTLDSPSLASLLRASSPLPLVSSNTFVLFYYYHHFCVAFVWIVVPLWNFFPIFAPAVIFPLAPWENTGLDARHHKHWKCSFQVLNQPS